MSTISKVYTPRKANNNAITIAPEFADIDIADTYNQLVDRQNTTIGELLTPDIMPASELQANMDYRNAFKQGDTITAVNNYFNTLDSYVNQPDFSLDAVLYWYQKATYSNKEITAYKSTKNHYNTFLLPNYIPGASLFGQNIANYTNHDFSYFNVVSDSIGIIANSKFIQLDNTLPLFDITQGYYGVPIPIAASTDNKISSITRNVMYNLSQKNTTIMRRNLMNIGYSNVALQQNITADATTSHGCNLINDLPTFVRVNEMLDQLKNKLAAVFSQAKTFSFVQYLNNIGNTTALNLRDIFPLASSDMDFTVITSDANAAAAAAIAQQQANDATAAQQIADQQYRIDVGNIGNSGNQQFLQGNSAVGQPISSGGPNAPATTNDPVKNYLYSIAERETGFSDAEANSNIYNQAGNNTNVARYGAAGADYGYYQMNANDVQDAINRGMKPAVAAALNNGGGSGSYTLEQQTAALTQYMQLAHPNAYAAMQTQNYDQANALLKGQWPSLPGGLSYRPANASAANKYLQPVQTVTTVASQTPILSPTTGG
jgi:hypothetical protein